MATKRELDSMVTRALGGHPLVTFLAKQLAPIGINVPGGCGGGMPFDGEDQYGASVNIIDRDGREYDLQIRIDVEDCE